MDLITGFKRRGWRRHQGRPAHRRSDELDYQAAEQIATANDVNASIRDLLGLDHKRLTCHSNGRNMRRV